MKLSSHKTPSQYQALYGERLFDYFPLYRVILASSHSQNQQFSKLASYLYQLYAVPKIVSLTGNLHYLARLSIIYSFAWGQGFHFYNSSQCQISVRFERAASSEVNDQN